jgi:hypothetical protein
MKKGLAEANPLICLVRPKRFELLTPWFVGRNSELNIFKNSHLRCLQSSYLAVFSQIDTIFSVVLLRFPYGHLRQED